MTKALAAVASVVFLLLAAPLATAHGAAPPREIDTRILADDDGLVGFGGCFEGQCPPAGGAVDGVDIVLLDAREAWLPSGDPVVIFHMVYQTADEDEGRTVALAFSAGGKEHTYSFETTGTSPATGDFDQVVGPYDVFDGYPKAVDGYLKYTTLGVKAGDSITGVTLTSQLDGEAADLMPGTWMTETGAEAPFIPNPEGELEQPDAGTYVLAGPAKLLDVTNDAVVGATNVTFTVKNPLTETPQFVNLTLSLPEGTTGSLDSKGVNLEAGASRSIKLTLEPGATAGDVMINVTSDLGYFGMVMLPMQGMAMPMNETMTMSHSGTHGGSEHDEPGASETDSKGTPATGGLALALALVAVAFIRRRL